MDKWGIFWDYLELFWNYLRVLGMFLNFIHTFILFLVKFAWVIRTEKPPLSKIRSTHTIAKILNNVLLRLLFLPAIFRFFSFWRSFYLWFNCFDLFYGYLLMKEEFWSTKIYFLKYFEKFNLKYFIIIYKIN